MPVFLKDLLAEVACKIVVFLIELIATSAGAEDLSFMLTERVGQPASYLARSILSSLGVAMIDRLLWFKAIIRDFDPAALAFVDVRESEACGFYFGSAIVAGFLDLKFVEHLVDLAILQTSAPLVTAKVAVVVCFLLAVYVLSALARFMTEMMDGFRDPFVDVSVVIPTQVLRRATAVIFALSGIACGFMLIQGNVHQGLPQIVGILVIAIMVAYGSGLMRERSLQNRRTRWLRSWGPGGRPFGRRDLTTR